MNPKPFLLFALLFLILIAGCTAPPYQTRDTSSIEPSSIRTFNVRADAEICTQDGKPIIRLYSTTTCPHCRWINSTFNGVMDEYMNVGKIVAMHWDVDARNDQFTPGLDGAVPPEETKLFESFNPNFSVPTFVFGCKYFRVGNAYETQNDVDAEAAEFKAVIERLLQETQFP
ncbi:MAG: hypothetical protein Q8P05_00170 [Candidatus Diapherotrites archaeon]|nr:hypothetical protein [Candidatus Diapherotrites archaeon]MDZ4256735.1 hypothetical protein [archaeon]